MAEAGGGIACAFTPSMPGKEHLKTNDGTLSGVVMLAHAHPPWLRAALVLGFGVIGGAAAVGVAAGWQGAPYNVRELLAAPQSVSAVLLAAAVVWLGVAVAWSGRWLAMRRVHMLAAPALTVGITLVSWTLISRAVTLESLYDVFGVPVLGAGPGLELFARFLALHGAIVLLGMAGVAVVETTRRLGLAAGLRRGGATLLVNAPYLLLARAVVIMWAATDNVTELIRSQPVPGDVLLGVAVMVIAINASCVAHMVWRRRWVHAAATTFVFALVSWLMVAGGLAREAVTYGQTYSAAGFLLGADRSAALSTAALFSRWAAVHVGLVAMLSCGAAAVGIVTSAPRVFKEPAPQPQDAYDAFLLRCIDEFRLEHGRVELGHEWMRGRDAQS